MEYQIEGAPVFTTLKMKLNQGEKILAESGAMISMSSTINLAYLCPYFFQRKSI